jgi:colanic acid biosynthesis glycosyl transferase WcaI
MKFLVLSQYYSPEIGATQVRLSAFCSQLIKAGHQVEVVTAMPHHPTGRIFPFYRGRFYMHEVRDGLSIHRVWVYAGNGTILKRILNYLSFAFLCFCGLLRAQRPDYVFVDSPPPFLGVPGWMAAKWHGVPLVLNVADLWPDSAVDLGVLHDGLALRFGYWLERWIYRRANYITAVTEGIRNTLIRSKDVPSTKILFLPNGVDTALVRPREADEALKLGLGLNGKKVVLYAGNHGYAGAADMILLAADRLRSEPAIHFLLVGDGPEKQRLKEMAKSLGLPNVTFHDPVPIQELPSFTSISDLAVVTLRKSRITRGARPAKALVMMAAGKPIVLSAEGEAEQLLRSASAGVIVPPEDPDVLANAIRSLINDPEALRVMGMNGRTFACDNFDWSILVGNWLSQLSGEQPIDLQTPKVYAPDGSPGL